MEPSALFRPRSRTTPLVVAVPAEDNPAVSPPPHSANSTEPQSRPPNTRKLSTSSRRRSTKLGASAVIPRVASSPPGDYHPGTRLDFVEIAVRPQDKYFPRTSDEIRTRQRADLAKSLVYGAYDRDGAAEEAEGVLEAYYPSRDVSDRDWLDEELHGGQGRRAAGRRTGGAALPVNRLDTADMMRFLAEQRGEKEVAGRRGSATAMSTTLNATNDSSHDDPDKTVPVEPRSSGSCFVRGKRFPKMRLAICTVMAMVLLGVIMGVALILFHVVVQANVNGLRIQWTNLELSDVTRDSFKLDAVGTLEGSTGLAGMVLESSAVEMLTLHKGSPAFGKLHLPQVACGDGGRSIHVNETVIVENRESLMRWSLSLTSVDTPPSLLLRGTSRVSLASGSFGTSVDLKPLPTQISQGLVGRLTYPATVDITLMPDGANDDGTVEFAFPLDLTNGGSIGVKDLGTTTFEVYKDNDVVALARVEKSVSPSCAFV